MERNKWYVARHRAMKITLCGSIAHYDRMREVNAALASAGHTVRLPPTHEPDDSGKMIPVEEYYRIRKAETSDTGWVWERKAEAIRKHFEKIDWCDVILVVNEEKRGISGYIGGNTLMEMGLAFWLKKPIYLLNGVPDVPYREEILGVRPIVLDGDLSRLSG